MRTTSSQLAADVIVVGAGSAGAALTRRLVDAGADVLLVEAGFADDNPAIRDPGRLFELWGGEEDWAYRTAPQPNAAGRRLGLPRGKVLGGSSSLNAMIYVRGNPADYDHWADLGCAGWSWMDVVPVFRRIEDHDTGKSEMDGTGGLVRIHSDYEPDPIHGSLVEAARETGIPFNADYNGDAQDGISHMQFSIKDGQRHSTARAYLGDVLTASNLRLVTGAQVRRLLLRGGRCAGVEWIRDGRHERALAGAEVVLSAGTMGSARILLLSGVGPPADLRAAGVEVQLGLPGVGRNLHDHLLSPVIFAAEREIGAPSPGLPPCQTHTFWRSRPSTPVPDLQPLHFMAPMYEDWMAGPDNGFTMQAGMIRPASRGTVRLSGSNPTDPLVIDLGALTCRTDLDSLVAAVRLCREIGAAPALSEWGAEELYPGPRVRDSDELRDYVRRTAITYHHQVGTCKMGVDDDSVVDPNLRVHGIEGLRVADASIMPAITTGNTNAPAIVIGERAADFISADAVRRSR